MKARLTRRGPGRYGSFTWTLLHVKPHAGSTAPNTPHEHPPIEAAWNDPKRYLWLLGLVVPTLPFLAWGIAELTGLGIGYWFGPLVVFGLIPLLDQLIGKDSDNPPDSAIKYLEQDRYYRWCTYLFLPLQLASLVFACWLWGSGDLSFLESLGLAVSVAMVGGIAINTAHELGHKRKSYERWLSKIALAQTGYGHFFIEHNRGHHVRVATPEDPASSRFGESFWEFLPRTVKGSLSSAIHLERERLERVAEASGKGRGGFWTIHNDVLNAWAMTVVLFAGLTLAFGIEVLPWLLVQAVIGFSLLEVVNYLEHYGLLRQKQDDGRYERCRARALLEQRQRRLQRLPLPPAAPLRPPRQPDPPLPGAAPLRGPAGAALGLRDDDRARLLPAAVAAGDGPARARPLRRRHRPRQHPAAQARADPAQVRGERRRRSGPPRRRCTRARGSTSTPIEATAFACPGCGYVYEEAAGAPREGFPAGTAWSDVPDYWCCPDCGVREKVDFVAGRRGGRGRCSVAGTVAG